MSSLTDFLDSGSTDAGVNAGEEVRKDSTLYDRGLRNEVNSDASKGSFYSGNAGVRADQLRQDLGFQVGDVQRQLSQTLADLTYKRILASTGLSL
jgi:hypothetical protein